MTLANNKKRARSECEKEARRAEILAAAREMIADAGFDGVTMSGLAKRAGLAKGTLYLYVRSKEELFLLLYLAALVDYVERFEALTDPDGIAAQMTGAALEIPLFLPLSARLVAVIEANVADAALFAVKREIGALGGRVVTHLSTLLALTPEKAAQVMNALTMAMQGAAQFDITAQRDPGEVPADLRQMFASHAFARCFPPAAELILSAVR